MTKTSVYQRIRSHLAYLRLNAAEEMLAQELDRATKQKSSHSVFLERLLALEVEATAARRHASHLRFASFPAPWRIEDFDFDAHPGLDRKLVDELATMRFVEEAANVLVIGPPGVGKTMLAIALGHLAVDAGYRVYFNNRGRARRALPSRRSRWAVVYDYAVLLRAPAVDRRRARISAASE